MPRRSIANIHVLNDQIRCAVVDEAGADVLVGENCAQLLHKLTLSILLKDDILRVLDNGKALIELLRAILVAHELLELWELARGDVDHFVLARVASNISILAFVVNLRASDA